MRYTVDDSNRLLIEDLPDARGSRLALERRVRVDGTWRLTSNHDLALTIDGAGRRERRTISLKGAVVSAEAHALVFALRQRDDERLRAAQRVTLSGRWQADARNRLTFLVDKADGAEDRLTFQGGWEVGKRHELVYRYRQRAGQRRRREEHTLVFAGAWDITRASRLVYRLAGSTRSAFEFRASVRSPSLLARDGRIVYDVGVSVSQGRLQRRQVALVGTWKLHRDLSVSFEVPYAGGRVRAIRFEGEAALGARDRVAVALHAGRREAIGVTVLFTRDLVRDARLFLRLRQDAQEALVIGGLQVRF